MIFSPLPIPGALLIDVEPQADFRGLFARTFCEREFAERGLVSRFVQSSTSFNNRRGTLRGLHFQEEPHGEVKLVRCTAGAIYDVIVDLRRGGDTFASWTAVELTAENRRAVYIPKGVAHGFQAVTDGTEVYYQISEYYEPASARGIRWDDEQLKIDWPIRPPILSEADAARPDLSAWSRSL